MESFPVPAGGAAPVDAVIGERPLRGCPDIEPIKYFWLWPMGHGFPASNVNYSTLQIGFEQLDGAPRSQGPGFISND
jgi:hypothetical protein